MQGTGLHLTITTPLRVFVDAAEIVSLRAEDESGSFGIRAGHADYVTLLNACVVRWRTADGVTHFCAALHSWFPTGKANSFILKIT